MLDWGGHLGHLGHLEQFDRHGRVVAFVFLGKKAGTFGLLVAILQQIWLDAYLKSELSPNIKP